VPSGQGSESAFEDLWEPMWSTSGYSYTDAGPEEEAQVLFAGRWEGGQSLSYPFEAAAPSGPISCEGKLFNS
jgi:hypothetical protein